VVTDSAALLGALAVPRLVGTPHHRQVWERLKRELAARGFAVEEHAFTARPSRMLFGTPTVVRGINLIASRPSNRPTFQPSIWLAAHYDSKGQPISMATRIVGAATAVLGAAATLLALAAGWTFIPGLVFLALGVAILSRNRVTDRSPGAVDNASGLVAVFAVLDALPRHADVGVLFLDAEEFGLLGARALVADRAALLEGAAVVNFDGLDDRGRPIAFRHRRGPVTQAVAAELGALRARWLPVLVDGIALAEAARECVTILKGDWGTARVVHTPRDTAQRLTLDGVRQVAAGVARALAAP
jgi:acetylornithine deacetylase/succinyl-diaminopimelate desuccinylase-like protein